MTNMMVEGLNQMMKIYKMPCCVWDTIIMYAVCTVLWCSKLQSETVLSTTEAEYIGLVQAMRKVRPFMALTKEEYIYFDLHIPKPEIFCKVFEDNQSCIAVT